MAVTVVSNGVFVPNQTVTTDLGTLTITGFTPIQGADGDVVSGTVTYSYALNDNTLDHSQVGADSVTDSFAVVVTDKDGSTDTASLDVQVIDDLPIAAADTGEVGEGATLVVDAASGVLSNDVDGADEFAAGGGVVGVRAAGEDTSGEVTTGVGSAIVGLYGTLTLHADGSYSYASTPNVVPPAGASDVFVYSVEDGDGDRSTATLTIDIADAGLAARTDSVTVDEAALDSVGSNPNSDAETANGTVADNVSGGTGPFTFALTGDGVGQFGTLTLNSDGTYSYALVTPIDGVTADDGALPVNGAETFDYEVTDANGNTATNTITVNIVDDVPSISATGVAPSLTVDETILADNASASFANVFTSGYGADGAGGIAYTLGVNVGATGLVDVATGQAVTLSLVSGQVQGVNTNGDIVFTLSVDGSGNVTLDQRRAVAHADATNPNDAETMDAANLITLTATVTDGDGDSATAVIDIADKLTFNDDGPVANDDVAGLTEGGPSSITIDVDTNDAPGADGTGSRVFTSLTGTYGDLTVNPDGTQTYTLTASGQAAIDALAPGATLTDSFTYTLTDKDGDSDPATLTVTLTGTDDPVTITNLTPSANGGDASVDEDDLAAGTDASKESLTQGGDFTISAPDGIANLSVGGHLIIVGGVFTATSFTTPLGNSLSITAYDASTGVVTYTYTLADAETHGSGNGENLLYEDFAVSLQDLDGDSAVDLLSIKIVDDVPAAVADSGNVTEGALLSVNAAAGVLSNDVPGADGFASAGAVVGVMAGSNISNPVAGNVGLAIAGTYGTLTLHADGHYTYQANANVISSSATDTFVYTMEDGDGDKSTTTLTINLTDVSLVADNQTKTVNEAALDTATSGSDLGHGTITGSNPALTTETATGTLAVAGATGYTAYTQTGTYGLFQLNADGTYTYTLTSPVDNLPHANDGTDTTSAAETFSYTAHDANGNTVTGTITVDVVDDVPMVSDGPDTLVIENSGTVSGTADFAYSIGADGRTSFSSSNSDFASIVLSGTVGGATITSPTVTWVSETSTSAQFNISFNYASGGSTVTATGTLTFDKIAGEYTVDLAEPIEAVTVSTVSNSSSIQGYEEGTSTPDNNHPDVAVAQVATNLFVQFTGFSEPGGGTGSNNLQAGGNTVFTNGEILTQTSDWVSISGTANGVGGDQMNKGQVLDLDFFTSNPFGHTALPATAEAEAIFFKLDGVGNNEDFIVVLKLVNADDPTVTTTKAVLVQNGDIIKGPGSGPGAYSTVILDNNDGLVVIESNDYNNTGENWVIVGAQFTSTDEGITGTAINLNGVTGSGGSSTTTQNWSADVNDTGFKVSDIGIVSTSTLAQDATLSFNVTLVDADGDQTAPQQLQVSITNPVPPVAIDLDGDGVEYLALSAGVTHDYGLGEVQTAWVAPDDGLLAHAIGDTYDIVFADDAAGATTDLEGARLAYDSNGDGFLTAKDAAFDSFGVWQDANSNGVVDAGEYQTLTALGITSIGLVSDGQSQMAANGDVLVHGEATYTINGQTGTIADVQFATSGTSVTQLEEKTLVNTGLNQALVAASLIAVAEQAAADTTQSATTDLVEQDLTVAAPVVDAVETSVSSDETASESGLLDSAADDGSVSKLPANESHQVQSEVEDSSNVFASPDTQTATDHSAPAQEDQSVTADASPPPMPVDLAPMMAAAAQMAEGEHLAGNPEALPTILADALTGGSGDGPDIDALLDALPQTAQSSEAPALPAAEPVFDFALAAAPSFHFDLAMMSHDAVAATTHA